MATTTRFIEELLVFLADDERSTLDTAGARRLLDQAAHEAPELSADERLQRAGRSIGLRLTAVEVGVAELRSTLREVGRAVIVLADGSWRGAESEHGDDLTIRRSDGSDEKTPLEELLGKDALAVTIWTAHPLHPVADGHAPAHGHPTPRQRLVQLLRAESSDLWVVTIYAAVIGLFSLAVPVAVQALVNNVVFGQLLQPIVVLTILLFGVLAIAGLMRALQARVVEWIQQRIFVRVAAELAHKLPRVRTDALEGEHAPELVNRFFDVLTVQKSAAVLLLDGLALVLQTGIGLVLVAFYHPLLLALSLLLMASVAFIVFGLGRHGPRTAIDESKAKYAVAAWLEEMARHPQAFKSGGADRFAFERTDELAKQYIAARRGHFRILFSQLVGSHALYAVASALLLGLGGWLVMSGQMSLGALVAAELVVGSVLYGVTKLGKQLDATYDLIAAVDKLGHLLDVECEREGGHTLTGSGPVSLLLRGVSISHGSGAPTITGADARVRAGEKVALLGREGSGKSTLLECLYGLRAPASGLTEIDGIDVREIDLASLRRAMAFVSGIEVFDGTVEENVRVGRTHVSRARTREALRQVGLYDDIAALPNGLDTRLPTGGHPLSDGQLRRLMLARAIAGEPRLLLLDEALDGLDENMSERLCRELLGPDAPWTVICTTRSRAIARRCERRLRLEDGRLVELSESEAA